MEKFTFGQMGLSTGLGKTLISDVEFAGLAAQFFSLYAYAVFTNSCSGFTPRIALLGVCRNEAAELAIDVEVSVFRGIVEEANVSFRGFLRSREGTGHQTDRQRQPPFHADQLPSAIRMETHYKA